MRVSGVLGLILLAALITSAISFGSGAGAFLNVPSVVIVLSLPVALGLLSFGFWDLGLGLFLVIANPFLRVMPFAVRPRHAAVVKGLIAPVYAAAVIAVLIGGIQMLRAVTMDDLSYVGIGVATLLLVPFYAVLLAECLVRPALNLSLIHI